MTSIQTSGTLDPLARHWLARAALQVMRVARRSERAKNALWFDDDIRAELGLEPWDSTRFDRRLKDLKKIVARGERKDLPRAGAAHRIADLLARPLELTLVERNVLALALLHQQEAVFVDLLDDHARTLARFARVAGPIIGASAESFLRALEPAETLARCRLVQTEDFRFDGTLTLHPGLRTLLRRPPKNVDDALRAFVQPGRASALTDDDVEHLRRDVDTAVALVKGALDSREQGVNVLLYGPPGTGKTETARLIAGRAGARVGEVPVTGDDDEKLGRARLGSYVFCQRLLQRTRRGLVIFDEIEDVIPRSALAALAGIAGAGDDKGRFGRTLEENPVPTVWTSNHVAHIDPALLRRFDLIIEMKVPPLRVRRRAVGQHLGPLGVSPAACDDLAADDRLAPAVVASAARVARITRGGLAEDVERTVARVVDNKLRVVAGRRRAPVPAEVLGYDLAFANASVDLDHLGRMIGDGRRATLCLYGPPGTGKTAFVRHAAAHAGRRLVVKRMSDLLSCWVGETEKNIAAMFEEARDEGAVLLLDEADGLLRSREDAEHAWELTQTNELLVQMEGFEGVFACATNLIDTLDPASFRRFDVKVRFEPLTRAQRRALLTALLGRRGIPADALDDVTARRLDRLDGLCAGHFAAVARRVSLLATAGDVGDVIAALEEEHRFLARATKVGFVA